MTTTDTLNIIADEACRRLRSSITEASDEILDAWNKIEGAAEEKQKQPSLTLSFASKVNLKIGTLKTKLSFGTREVIECNAEIVDPNQETLPMEIDRVQSMGN